MVVRGSSVPPVRLTLVNTRPAGESCGEFPGVDVQDLARHLPDAWAAWLRASFRNPADIQRAFGVSERTVRDWLACVSAPRAPVILKAVVDYPSAMPALLRRAA